MAEQRALAFGNRMQKAISTKEEARAYKSLGGHPALLPPLTLRPTCCCFGATTLALPKMSVLGKAAGLNPSRLRKKGFGGPQRHSNGTFWYVYLC
jgi:hypothetical protein